MELIWSQLASKHLLEVAEYVEENFGARVAEEKVDLIIKRMNRLLLFPESGVLDREYSTEDFSVHHLNMYPNVIYYMLENDHLIVMSIFHNRQSPKTMRSILKRFLETYNK